MVQVHFSEKHLTAFHEARSKDKMSYTKNFISSIFNNNEIKFEKVNNIMVYGCHGHFGEFSVNDLVKQISNAEGAIIDIDLHFVQYADILEFGHSIDESNRIMNKINGLPFCRDAMERIPNIVGEAFHVYYQNNYIIGTYYPEIKTFVTQIDVLHLGSEFNARTLENILKIFLLCLVDSINENINLSPEERIRLQEEKFKELIILQSKEQLKRLEREYNDLCIQIKEYKKHIIRVSDNISLNMANIEALKNNSDKKIEKIINEIKTIKNIKKVESILCSGSGLIINTEELWITFTPDIRYYLGKYIINVNIKTGNITFKTVNPKDRNKSYWGNNCHHPHVNQEGEACLGNASAIIVDLLSSQEYYALTTILINFLESVNIEDAAGKYVYKWPCFDSNGKKLSKQPSIDDLFNIINPTRITEPTTHCDSCGDEIEGEPFFCNNCGLITCIECYENNEGLCNDCYDEEHQDEI